MARPLCQHKEMSASEIRTRAQVYVSGTPVQSQIDERAQRNGCRPLGKERLGVVQPGGTGDIDVNPGGVFGELFEEHGGRARASPTRADVLDIGVNGLELVAVFVVEWHVPHLL